MSMEMGYVSIVHRAGSSARRMMPDLRRWSDDSLIARCMLDLCGLRPIASHKTRDSISQYPLRALRYRFQRIQMYACCAG